jgi:lipopolysaccharide transport system ATP-binding protein
MPDGSKLYNQYFTPLKFCLIDVDGFIINRVIDNSEPVFVQIIFNVTVEHPSLNYGYSVYDSDNQLVYSSLNVDSVESDTHKPHLGENTVVSAFPRRLLNEGDYRIEIVSSLHHITWINEIGNNDISFNIKIKGSLSDSPYWMERRAGVIAPVLKWTKVR